MKKTNNTRRGGFTLVEMLVVIAIIGIIASILVPTLYIAVRKAKENKIAQEVNMLAMTVEEYKQKYADVPPDFTNALLVQRHLRRAFGRHADVFSNTAMTLPNGLDATGTSGRFDVANLDPSEALVFWLGMIKNDPREPLNGTSKPEPLFPFDETRLIDLDGDGWLSYVPPDGKDMPYVYFESRTYGDPSMSTGAEYLDPTGTKVYPYKTDRPIPNTNPAVYPYVNRTTYQIISAGLDGEFGDDPTPNRKLFPSTPDTTANLLWSLGDLDNIANFSDGRIFEDHTE